MLHVHNFRVAREIGIGGGGHPPTPATPPGGGVRYTAVAGIIILTAGVLEHRPMIRRQASEDREASLMGVVQGLSLPFRGFSRSGSTISAGMLAGTTREHAETSASHWLLCLRQQL
jgi:hypothetical protein